MLRLAVMLILLLVALFGGTVWLLDMQPNSLEPGDKQAKEKSAKPGREAKTTPEPGKSDVDAVQEALTPPKPGDAAAPAFDIARIDPNGTSVFAGRAEPNSAVTITADGKELGTAQADENGEWTFTTDQKIANPDAKLALFKAPPGTAAQVADAASRAPDVKPQTPPVPTAKS